MTDKNTKNGRLIIVDPSLKDTRGHHYALTRVIVESVINSGSEVVVFSSLSADRKLQIPGARIRRVFSKTTYDYFKTGKKTNQISLIEKIRLFVSFRLPESIKIILRKARSKLILIRSRIGGQVKQGAKPTTSGELLDELLDALVKEKVTSVGHILVHTTDGMMYRTILHMLQKKYPLGEYPSFHLCTPYDMRIMPHAAHGMPVENVIRYMSLQGFIGRKVFLYAENELLADDLSDAWGVEVNTLDIPMRKNVLMGADQLHEESVFRVVYLGAAREEKGFHLIPEVIETVLSQNDTGCTVEFVIQCSPQIVGYTKKIEAAIGKLKNITGKSVRLIQTQQSELEYYSVLDSSDVVLCCYQQENYRVRGSGIATEAVAFGKTVITTPETYPEWLVGNSGISATGGEAIAAAIMSVMENRDDFRAKAKERAEWFSDRTRPEEYMNKLLVNEENARKNEKLAKGSEAQNNSNAVGHDDSSSENKYNAVLNDAAVSDDGKVLFVQQISK